MSIYRGAGGAGDAVTDSASEALLIRELALAVQEDADAAAASATSASGSASTASTAATNASNSAILAATYTPSQTGNSGKFLITNGTATSWAAALTSTAIGVSVQDYDANTVKSNANQTFTKLQTLTGSTSEAALKTTNIKEVITVSATAATGTINYDATTQSVLYYTTNASGNFTVNFRASSGTTLNTLMATGESMSFTFMVTNGGTAYYNSAVQVDGSAVTPKWQGGTAPTSGNASSIDIYNYVIIKTGSAAFTVLASVTKFA